MRFTDFLSEACISPRMRARNKAGALGELAELLAVGTGARPERLHALLTARERIASTAIGQGVAIPHCKLEGLPGIVACVGLCPEGFAFDTPGAEPVRLLVGLVAPPRLSGVHVGVLSRVVALLKDERLCAALMRAPSARDLRALLVRAEDVYLGSRGLSAAP
ncbi:PTS sugar transporter subunit IIA [Myxococcaceae bacterium GXIMD 01537]